MLEVELYKDGIGRALTSYNCGIEEGAAYIAEDIEKGRYDYAIADDENENRYIVIGNTGNYEVI